jgi:hypothetical protein
MNKPPAYAVTSGDHALRLAVVLQMEGFRRRTPRPIWAASASTCPL